MDEKDPLPEGRTGLLWDLPVRIFHWLLPLGIIALYISAEQGEMEIHGRIGVTILALVLTRLIWGVIGSDTARFRHFVRGPRAVVSALRALMAGSPHHEVGHNAAGALMVVALLAMLLTQGVLGMFSNDDILFEGPLARMVGSEWSGILTGWHHRLFDLLVVLIGLHIVAVLYYRFGRKEDLIRPMLNGRKEFAVDPQLRFRARGWALLILVFWLGVLHFLVWQG